MHSSGTDEWIFLEHRILYSLETNIDATIIVSKVVFGASRKSASHSVSFSIQGIRDSLT